MTDGSEKPWALVTGASSGIGRALSVEFAKNGYNLVVISRDQEALQVLADQCRQSYQSEILVVTRDLTREGIAVEIVNELDSRGIVVDVLINNAGFGVHGDFMSTPLNQELDMVRIQINIMLELTKYLLPGMIQKKKGAILNVGSVYSYSPVPFQAVYGACKAFMFSFSDSIGNELKDKGITVSLLCPGVTRTAFRRRAGMKDKKSTSGLSAEEVAKAGFLAVARGKKTVVPGFWNKVFVTLVRIIPRVWVSPVMRRINQIRGVAPKASG